MVLSLAGEILPTAGLQYRQIFRLFRKSVRGSITPVHSLPEGTSPQLDAIVRKLLAPQPGHRYPTAAQLLEDLQRYADGSETMAHQQLVNAGRATRVVSRSKAVAPGAPTLPVPPPLPPPRGAGLVSPAEPTNEAPPAPHSNTRVH